MHIILDFFKSQLYTYVFLQERALLDRVAQKVSSPSNTFILFNHWDTVENRKGADKVKQQHLKKVDEILVKQLQVYTAEMAQKRTFFVSAEEAFTACDVQHQTALNEQSRGKTHASLVKVPM